MILDKKGKLFGKISIVDVLIILIILSVAVGVYFKFNKVTSSTAEENVIIYLSQEEVLDSVAHSIKKGDIVIEDIQSAEFGHVKDVYIDKSISWAQTSDGEYKKSSKEGYSSVNIVVGGKGSLTGQGFYIGLYKFYIGKSYTIRIGNTMIYPRISDIKVSD